MVAGGRSRCIDVNIEIDLPYPDAWVASILTCPQGPCKYAIKGRMQIRMRWSEVLSQTLFCFGSNIASVLVLPLLWAAYEENMTVNGYTLLIIPSSLTSAIKECWIAAGNYLIKKSHWEDISWCATQLVIVAIQCPGHENVVSAVQTDGRDAEQVVADRRIAPATNTGSKGYWSGKSEGEILFS